MVGGQMPPCALCAGAKTVSKELATAYTLLLQEMSSHEAILTVFKTAPNLLSAQARILVWQRLNYETYSD
jgi:hypothetical protein